MYTPAGRQYRPHLEVRLLHELTEQGVVKFMYAHWEPKASAGAAERMLRWAPIVPTQPLELLGPPAPFTRRSQASGENTYKTFPYIGLYIFKIQARKCFLHCVFSISCISKQWTNFSIPPSHYSIFDANFWPSIS